MFFTGSLLFYFYPNCQPSGRSCRFFVSWWLVKPHLSVPTVTSQGWDNACFHLCIDWILLWKSFVRPWIAISRVLIRGILTRKKFSTNWKLDTNHSSVCMRKKNIGQRGWLRWRRIVLAEYGIALFLTQHMAMCCTTSAESAKKMFVHQTS